MRPTQVEVASLAAECAASVETLLGPDVELRQDLEDAGSIRTDRELLRRVLMNLLGNAAKFTEHGHIALNVRPGAGLVEVTVSDTGMGIPAEDLRARAPQ